MSNQKMLRLMPFLYLIIGAFIIFNNPIPLGLDIFSYFSIGRKYSMGDVFNALNGYWAPLLPWLLAIAFKIGFFWRGIQLVNLIAGFLLVVFSIRIALLLKLSKTATWLLVILISLLSVAHQLNSSTPDFLSVACFVVFAFYYYNDQLNRSRYGWIKTSVAALFLIFCKVFYFYFFIAVLMVHAFYGFWKNRKERKEGDLLKTLLKQLALVVAVYSIWVLALSLKYERFVFSATGSYNSALITPQGQAAQYYSYSGLTAPPCDYSFGNEDPTYAFVQSRNPFESRQAFNYQLEIFAYNFRILLYLFSYLSYFKWLILLLPLVLLFFENTPERNIAIGFFLMGGLILFGYFLVFYEDRYVLPVLFCFIYSAFFLFDRLSFSKRPLLKIIILFVPFIAFGKNSIDTVKVWRLYRTSYAEARTVSDKLVGSKLFEGKRIANSSDGYGGTYLSMLALETTSKYYGELGMFHSHERNFEELKKHQIEYLFYFDCARIDEKGACIDHVLPFYLKDKEIVYSDPSARLTVYKLF